ncbi:MAG: hypothetical protein ACFFCS_23140 [Candidatus Hodarchaeota archaeon]
MKIDIQKSNLLSEKFHSQYNQNGTIIICPISDMDRWLVLFSIKREKEAVDSINCEYYYPARFHELRDFYLERGPILNKEINVYNIFKPINGIFHPLNVYRDLLSSQTDANILFDDSNNEEIYLVLRTRFDPLVDFDMLVATISNYTKPRKSIRINDEDCMKCHVVYYHPPHWFSKVRHSSSKKLNMGNESYLCEIHNEILYQNKHEQFGMFILMEYNNFFIECVGGIDKRKALRMVNMFLLHLLQFFPGIERSSEIQYNELMIKIEDNGEILYQIDDPGWLTGNSDDPQGYKIYRSCWMLDPLRASRAMYMPNNYLDYFKAAQEFSLRVLENETLCDHLDSLFTSLTSFQREDFLKCYLTGKLLVENILDLAWDKVNQSLNDGLEISEKVESLLLSGWLISEDVKLLELTTVKSSHSLSQMDDDLYDYCLKIFELCSSLIQRFHTIYSKELKKLLVAVIYNAVNPLGTITDPRSLSDNFEFY